MRVPSTVSSNLILKIVELLLFSLKATNDESNKVIAVITLIISCECDR